jgi:hypothetical protein
VVCRSPEAVDQFLRFCGRQAFDLLAEHGTVLMSLQIILRMRRTMTGSELTEAIRSVLAYRALARERWRRKDWQRREENAAKFREQWAAIAD